MHHQHIKRLGAAVCVTQATLFVCVRSQANIVYRVQNNCQTVFFIPKQNVITMLYRNCFHFIAGGIFLLLGYSSIDESLLRSYTNLGIPDTVRAFQQYLQRHIDNQVRMQYNDNFNIKIITYFLILLQTLCVLSFFNITQENIIITVRLPLGPNTDPVDQFKKEKVCNQFSILFIFFFFGKLNILVSIAGSMYINFRTVKLSYKHTTYRISCAPIIKCI